MSPSNLAQPWHPMPFEGEGKFNLLLGGNMRQSGEMGIDYLINEGLGHLVNSARNVVVATLEKELLPLELTSAQFMVVIAAIRGRARTVSEFCAFAGVDAWTMSRLLDRLESRGIVHRMRDCADRRQVRVELTEMGHTLSPQIMPLIAKVNRKFLTGFSAEDAEHLQTLLQRLLANAD